MQLLSWSVVAATFLILLGYHETCAAVTLLLERSDSNKNSSDLASKIQVADKVESDRVSEKIILTKDKTVRDAWRTEKGDLVELQLLNMYSTPKDSPIVKKSAFHVSTINPLSDSATVTDDSSNQLSSTDSYPGVRSSHRMKRTFWPFTSLFGYDYPPPFPPNYGMYGPGGPMMPPFGGGFGGVMGGGFGYPGPAFGPPPPLGLGLGFTMGF